MMFLSLYAILAYTWSTDLRARSKSNEINYGLAEYWNGGISSRAERVGRNSGKLFNDDAEDDAGLTKILSGINGDIAGDLEDTPDITKRRPALSYARKVTNASHLAYEAQSRRAQANQWTITKTVRNLVWILFILLLIEASVAELKRCCCFYSARRLRAYRGAIVHNL